MKKTLAILFLALAALGASGETFYETSFQEIGYNELVVDGAKKTECTEIKFLLPQETLEKEGIYPIISLYITAAPTTAGTASVDVQLNDLNITNFRVSDLVCFANECWKRIRVVNGFCPPDAFCERLFTPYVQNGENSLVVCLHTSNTITNLTLSNSSLIGLYSSPVISIESVPEKQEIFLGDSLSVRLIVTNTGSEATNVEFGRAREVASDKNAFRVIDGNTSWRGVLEAKQSKGLSYSIKPKTLGPISLPPAIAIFENIFGEKETLFAKPAMIRVNPPEKALETSISKKEEIVGTGNETTVAVTVQNITDEKIDNIQVMLSTDMEIVSDSQKTISVAPRDSKSVSFRVKSDKAGEFFLGCIVKYDLGKEVEQNCQQQSIVVAEQVISPTIILGAILLVIGIAIYAFIQYSK